MDDQRFDDIIRQKANSFEDTGHDAHALTDFRERMANLPAGSWSNRWGKTGYLIGAMALFTLINFGVVWYFSEGRYMAMSQEISQLQAERRQLITDKESTDQAQIVEHVRVDTIYVNRSLLVPATNTTIYTPNQSITSTEATSALDDVDSRGDHYYLLLDNDQQISEELEALLVSNNLMLTGKNGEKLLIISYDSSVPKIDVAGSENYTIAHSAPKYLEEVTVYEQPESSKEVEKRRMSSKMQWALEKHNHRGVDIQFGIEGVYHKSNFDVGEGERNAGIGLMTELIFSPTWRLETGIHFGDRAYKITDPEISMLPPEFFDDYPGYDDQRGAISSLESDAALIKIPINLKRFAPLDHNKKWYASIGLTPQWSRNQEIEYKYSREVPDNPEGGDFVSFVGSKQEIEGMNYYTTTLNLGLGTEVYLDKRLRWQLGVFYQRGLGTAGFENRKLESSYGIKSSLWFNKP